MKWNLDILGNWKSVWNDANGNGSFEAARAERVDRDGDGTFSGDPDDNFFYLTDVMFSVRAVVDGTGLLHTRLDYTPYGVAMHGKAADVNGDGILNNFDITAFSGVYNGGTALRPGETGYDPDADLSGSGSMNFFDYTAFTGRLAAYSSGGPNPTFNDGWIDNPNDDVNGPDNSVGYDGYWFDLAGATETTSTGLYMVRFRVYDPKLGRWLQRDFAGYQDGSSLYNAIGSSPVTYIDPLGLFRIPGNAGTYELNIPLGLSPCSFNASVTLHDEDECGCRGIDLTVVVSCSIKEKVTKFIPFEKVRDLAERAANFDLALYDGLQGSGRICKDCIDFCEVGGLIGGQAGSGRRGGGGSSERRRDPAFGMGCTAEGSIKVTVCKGTWEAEVGWACSLNLNIRLPFRFPLFNNKKPAEMSYNFDWEGIWYKTGWSGALKIWDGCN